MATERPPVAVRVGVREEIPALFELINAAYMVELGEEGVAFKSKTRYESPDELLPSIDAGQCLVASDAGGAILGCIVYTIDTDKSECHFGPFAVAPAAQGRGVGSALLRGIDAVALAAGVAWVTISVINIRSDIIPMYLALGFREYGTGPYPAAKASHLTRPVHFLLMRRPVPGGPAPPPEGAAL